MALPRKLTMPAMFAMLATFGCGQPPSYGTGETANAGAAAPVGTATAEASRTYWNAMAERVNACLRWTPAGNPGLSAAQMLNSTLSAIGALPRQDVDAQAVNAADALAALRRDAQAITTNMIAAAAADHGMMAAGGYQGGGGYVAGYSIGSGLVAGAQARADLNRKREETNRLLGEMRAALSSRYGQDFPAIRAEDGGCLAAGTLAAP